MTDSSGIKGVEDKRALVLFSGGQDSTTALAWALTRFAHVETIGFSYGQRHGVELTARKNVLAAIRSGFPDWSKRLGADHQYHLEALAELSETALTREVEIALSASGLPNTFVPGRNLLFLTYAAALGYRRDLLILVAGMCETDYSGYPDCRHETLQAQAQAIRLGMDKDFQVETPLMWLNKAQTFELAYQLGGEQLIEIILEQTHSCYLGERNTRFAWGYGCGECPACQLRAKGFEDWQAGAYERVAEPSPKT